VVANRTRERAQELVERFRDQPAQARAAGLDELAGCIFDLLINGTSAGLTGDALAVGPGVFAPGARAYDMIYAPGSTPFLDWASAAGVAQRADGRGMLVEQAAESFFLWRGLRPETAPVIAALTALLGAP
jgi:shikimate dehydrogenase